MTRVAVVGHVEWMEFARVPRLPAPGENVHVTESWEDAGGGDVRHVFASAELAVERLGFSAREDFEAGMREFASAPLRS